MVKEFISTKMSNNNILLWSPSQASTLPWHLEIKKTLVGIQIPTYVIVEWSWTHHLALLSLIFSRVKWG